MGIISPDLLVLTIRELSKFVTGSLLTEAQIQSVTKNVVGQYFSDFFPSPQREAEAEARIKRAKHHITEATTIITGLQEDLEKQTFQLEALANEIEEKKKIADRYAVLAKTNQEVFTAYRAEMEDTIRKELVAQSEKGKRVRRLASFIAWLITLLLGAALGAYFQFRFEPYFKKATPQNQARASSPAHSAGPQQSVLEKATAK